MAEVMVSRDLFSEILTAIAPLRPLLPASLFIFPGLKPNRHRRSPYCLT